MSILINKNTRLVVQGITGHDGLFHTRQMAAYGTNIVAGVTPGKGGEWEPQDGHHRHGAGDSETQQAARVQGGHRPGAPQGGCHLCRCQAGGGKAGVVDATCQREMGPEIGRDRHASDEEGRGRYPRLFCVR